MLVIILSKRGGFIPWVAGLNKIEVVVDKEIVSGGDSASKGRGVFLLVWRIILSTKMSS